MKRILCVLPVLCFLACASQQVANEKFCRDITTAARHDVVFLHSEWWQACDTWQTESAAAVAARAVPPPAPAAPGQLCGRIYVHTEAPDADASFAARAAWHFNGHLMERWSPGICR